MSTRTPDTAPRTDERYRHLHTGGQPGSIPTNWGWESPARYRLRRVVGGSRLLRMAVRRLGAFGAKLAALAAHATALPDEEERNRRYSALLADDLATANEQSSGYGSADAIAEFTTAVSYARVLQGDPALDRTGTVETMRCIEDTFAQLAHTDPGIRRCLNFGVSYGYADARLAARFPGIEFVGLDRSRLTKTLNELLHTAPAGNLTFLADDVFRVLQEGSWARSVFLHARTLVQLPKAFIERLYSHVHAAGFEYVLGFEPVGISRVTRRNFPYSDEPRPSELHRDNLFLHNYPGLLRKAGFAAERIDLANTSHPQLDYRLLYFVARRIA